MGNHGKQCSRLLSCFCAGLLSIVFTLNTYAEEGVSTFQPAFKPSLEPTLEPTLEPVVEPIYKTDSEANSTWFSEDVRISAFDHGEDQSFLGKGELWADNWGVSANLVQNDQNDLFGFPNDSKFFNLDVKRRFGSRDKSNFELGLGWQELNIDSILDASGPRVSLSGKLNLFSSFQVYGMTSYFPELADDLEDNDGTAYELEAGVMYKPFPRVSFKAGYRHFSLDIEQNSVVEEIGSSSGFLLGTDLSW